MILQGRGPGPPYLDVVMVESPEQMVFLQLLRRSFQRCQYVGAIGTIAGFPTVEKVIHLWASTAFCLGKANGRSKGFSVRTSLELVRSWFFLAVFFGTSGICVFFTKFQLTQKLCPSKNLRLDRVLPSVAKSCEATKSRIDQNPRNHKEPTLA